MSDMDKWAVLSIRLMVKQTQKFKCHLVSGYVPLSLISYLNHMASPWGLLFLALWLGIKDILGYLCPASELVSSALIIVWLQSLYYTVNIN